MKLLSRIIALAIYLIIILAAHIFIINFLPYPFNHINIIVALFLLIITVSVNNRVIWLALAVSYVAELFSSIPFGIGTISLLCTLFIINWFQFNILTNRSVYMIFLSAVLGITLYRVLFVSFLTVHSSFRSLPGLPYKEIIADTGWEILLSSLLLFVLYFINTHIIKLLHPGARKDTRLYG